MRTTRLGFLAALAALGAAVGWSTIPLLEVAGGIVSPPHWSAAAGLGFFAALLLLGAWHMYDRVHRQHRATRSDRPAGDGRGARRDRPAREPVEPLLAFRLLVLAKASALVGALVCGVYTGLAIRLAVDAPSGAGWSRAWAAVAAAVCGAAVVVGALLLERACKVPPDSMPESNASDPEPHNA